MSDADRFDLPSVRSRFPALRLEVAGRPAAYLDGPGGTQVPDEVIAAMSAALEDGMSNVGGRFAASERAGEYVIAARQAMADLFGSNPEEVVFGQNMTSLTFAFSRAIARDWQPGDNIVVTELDHDANSTPWRLAAADRGVEVRTVALDPGDGTLDLASLDECLSPNTRLLAVAAASNALGTVTPMERIVSAAHAAGALVYVDAVHLTPHRRPDVGAWGADFAVCSAYKFFGPHTGIAFGRAEHLERLVPYKVVPAPDRIPDRWETGTMPFESLAGVTAAVDYIAGLGDGESRRQRLVDAYRRIDAHERGLSARFMEGASSLGAIDVFGITDRGRLDERVSTFAVDVSGVSPKEVAARLGAGGLFVWDGDYYARAVMDRLGRSATGGLVRIGFVHYSTTAEVDRVLEALSGLG
jgi:cysteine desulfurase family protein (TIGR01976 family)